MSAFAPDVAGYLRRIGFEGSATPSLECLRGIQRRHSLAVPFENLEVAAGRPVPIDGPSVEGKLLGRRRGGYCFEQNGYLLAVLREIGFGVTPYLARVRWNVPAGAIPARTHLALKVETEAGPMLFDVGFGGVGIAEPVPWEGEGESASFEGALRVRWAESAAEATRTSPPRAGVVQAKVGGTWADVYELSPDRAEPADWELANWYTSTHPQSRFRQNLIVARATPDGRCAILNREFIRRKRGETAERSAIGDPEHLLRILREEFGLHFEPGTRFGSTGAAWPA